MPDKTFHSEFLNRCSTVHLLELLSKPNSHVRLRLNVDHSISSNGHHLKQLSDWLDLSLSITLFHLLFNPFKILLVLHLYHQKNLLKGGGNWSTLICRKSLSR
ncbi:uncharacterized protein [Euphorbia lathyris]